MTDGAGVIATYAARWEAGDLTMFDLYAEDVVAHYGGTSQYAGTHVGKQRFLEVLIETTGRSDRRLEDVLGVFEAGDRGALFVRESLVVDGERVEVERALRYRIADGLIAECWLYDQDQQLIDRAWADPAD